MSKNRHQDYSEDMFAETRMTFGEHLEELRVHLIKALYGFGIALLFSLIFLGKPMLGIISAPVTTQLEAFYLAHAQQVVEDLDRDALVQHANRRRWIGISMPLTLLDQIRRGDAQRQWPADDRPLTFAELMERAYLDLTNADNAHNSWQWDRLSLAAADLTKIANHFTSATEVPASYGKKRLEALGRELKTRAEEVSAAADAQDRPRTQNALRRLGLALPLEEMPSQQLFSFRVQMDDPVLFADAINEALSRVQYRFGLAALSITESLMAWFKVGMVCGLVIGCPWIFYQLWLFIAAGLYPHEKRLVNVYLPVSVGLFLIGVVICQLFVMPKAIEALLWFNEWLGIKPDLRFNEWLGFAIMMPVVFGVSFQLPLVMMFLERVGILTVETYMKQWKIAFFLIHVFAAIITPSVDLISMELLALPMFGLYWLAIVLCQLRPHGSDSDIDVPDEEEPVGV